jgi:hypothetical protein
MVLLPSNSCLFWLHYSGPSPSRLPIWVMCWWLTISSLRGCDCDMIVANDAFMLCWCQHFMWSLGGQNFRKWLVFLWHEHASLCILVSHFKGGWLPHTDLSLVFWSLMWEPTAIFMISSLRVCLRALFGVFLLPRNSCHSSVPRSLRPWTNTLPAPLQTWPLCSVRKA